MSLVAEVLEKGFVHLEDPDMGRIVGEMGKHNLLSVPGLTLLRSILHDSVSLVSKLSGAYHLIVSVYSKHSTCFTGRVRL